MNKKWIITLAVIISAFLIFTACEKKDDSVEFTIGITQIVEHSALDLTREGFIAGLKEAGFSENVKFIIENAQGDMATAQLIAQNFVDEDVDMIFAIATPTAQAAFNATKDIPIMISAVTDPLEAGLVKSLNKPGTNVSGTSDKAPIGMQIDLLTELNINAKTIGFLYNTSEKNSEVQLTSLEAEADKRGIKIISIGITSVTEIEPSLDILLQQIDVLYTPTDNIIATSIQLIAEKALAKNIPVLAAEPELVKAGALITFGVDYFDLGKQTGLMAAKVLNGEDISKMPIEISTNPQVVINIKTAKQLGIEISEELKTRSLLVGE